MLLYSVWWSHKRETLEYMTIFPPSSFRPCVLPWISSASRVLFREQDEAQIYSIVRWKETQRKKQRKERTRKQKRPPVDLNSRDPILRGVCRDHCFPVPFPWFLQKTGQTWRSPLQAVFPWNVKRKTRKKRKNTASVVAFLGAGVQPRPTV